MFLIGCVHACPAWPGWAPARLLRLALFARASPHRADSELCGAKGLACDACHASRLSCTYLCGASLHDIVFSRWSRPRTGVPVGNAPEQPGVGQVVPGDLFVSMEGSEQDGNDAAEEVRARPCVKPLARQCAVRLAGCSYRAAQSAENTLVLHLTTAVSHEFSLSSDDP